ncbi:MAG: 50S ribosomal protein L3 [Pyrinomonadaceae bacterium]|nr:50S ribosomal protein L3 [Pyrinomonadaceae bacterium]
MINGIIGRKIGMTQIFAEDGTVTPVTVIKAGPCVVVQTKKESGSDGYNAVQLGLVEDKPIRMKRVSKPMRGHFEKTGGGVPPTRVLKEIRLDQEPEAEVGEQVKADVFSDGDQVDVVGKSKGRGFAGTIKRHNFSRGPMTHGSMNVRRPGSIGQSATPSRVMKGTRSSGHMGHERVTVQGLTVAKVEADDNLIMIKGAVPGPNGGLVVVKKTAKQKG